jgi:transcriptional regulator with XRE-family HTH domain
LKSTWSHDYQRLLTLLVERRRAAGITQEKLAGMLKRPQSFVSKFERGERRLDVIEFVQIVRLIGADPYELLVSIEKLSRKRPTRQSPSKHSM